MNIKFSIIQEALEDMKAGKMIIVVDDEDRENEGDLVMAAEHITPESINFMITEGRGLVCAPVSGKIADRLNFHDMVSGSDAGTCPFAVSVDARDGVSTGTSAADRAKTIQKMIDPQATPKDFLRPGHVFPLRAKEGGCLVRAGHTEASIDLCFLAGLTPAAVVCEIMNSDGSMSRLPDLQKFAEKHALKIISIEQIIEHRQKQEVLVKEVARSNIPTVFGEFTIHIFKEKITGTEHVAMVKGNLSKEDSPLVRVHSECLTGDVFRSLRCDCRPQLDAALHAIAEEGCGVLLRMAQEGRGIGLAAKIQAYALQDDKGLDTVEANRHLGYKDDLRDYGTGAQILKLLGISKMRLLTNNPRKIVGLSGYGLEIINRTPIVVGESETNTKYLQTKRKKMGHLK